MNGQEKENEIYNVDGVSGGAAMSAEFWMYDARLGRRWNVDPIYKPWESPYATFGNNPIALSDAFGLNSEESKKGSEDEKDKGGNSEPGNTPGGSDEDGEPKGGKQPPPKPDDPKDKQDLVQQDFHFEENRGSTSGSTGWVPSSVQGVWRSFKKDGMVYVEERRFSGHAEYYRFKENGDGFTGRGKAPYMDVIPFKAPPKLTEPEMKLIKPKLKPKKADPIITPPDDSPGDPPCDPGTFAITFNWFTNKAKPTDAFEAGKKIGNACAKWKPCHTGLLIVIYTPIPEEIKRDENSDFDGGSGEKCMELRANLIRNYLQKCNNIPSSAFGPIFFDVKYGIPGSPHVSISFF